MGILETAIGTRRATAALPRQRGAAAAMPPARPSASPRRGAPDRRCSAGATHSPQQVTELHWDLGGLAYEMAIRDHFRLDVLVRRAAVLQERDAELAEVERLLRMEERRRRGQLPAAAPRPTVAARSTAGSAGRR